LRFASRSSFLRPKKRRCKEEGCVRIVHTKKANSGRNAATCGALTLLGGRICCGFHRLPCAPGCGEHGAGRVGILRACRRSLGGCLGGVPRGGTGVLSEFAVPCGRGATLRWRTKSGTGCARKMWWGGYGMKSAPRRNAHTASQISSGRCTSRDPAGGAAGPSRRWRTRSRVVTASCIAQPWPPWRRRCQ